LKTYNYSVIYTYSPSYNVLVLVSGIYQHCEVSSIKNGTILCSQINYSTVKPQCIAAEGTMVNKQ